MSKIAIFSGSFNPIHIGHLALANWLCEYENLDELWFMVSPLNPLKKKDFLMDDRFRYELVQAAVANYPKCKACDFEFSLPRPSYTINTMRKLRESFPDNTFSLVIGADCWKNIGLWREADALLHEFSIIIYPRHGYDVHIPEDLQNVQMVNAPLMEISSTFVRQALREGKDIPFFLPEAIRKQIPVIKKYLQ